MQLHLGSKIRQLRHRDGRTQEALAEALGVTSQAVSRWESGGSYPDMEMIPSIAHYFGVTIDELFGYCNERSKRIDAIVQKIRDMNGENNGVDISIGECIRLAREALIEFPGNEKLMLCLASVLYNAGYVRYGEHHLKDEDGYDIYDADRHRTYAEWKEAIKLYEMLLATSKDDTLRHQAVGELIRLYVNIGESEKAVQLATTCADLHRCRELMLAAACDGKKRAEYLGEAVLKLISTAADQMIQCLISIPDGAEPELAIGVIQNAIGLFDHVCVKGEYGLYHAQISRLYLYMSEFQWRRGECDDAFASLDKALAHAKAHDGYRGDADACYSAPILSNVKINPRGYCGLHVVGQLAEYWPWWCVPNFEDVKSEMQADPRWKAWVDKTRE